MSLRRSTRTAGKPPRFADSAYSYDASAMARKPSASAAKRAKAAPSAAVAVAPSAPTIARFAGTPTIASALVASAMRLNIGAFDAGKVQALALSNLFNERYDSTTKASDIRSDLIRTMRRKRLASESSAAASGAGGGSSSSSSGGGRVAKRAATSSSSSSSSASAAKRAKAASSAAAAPSARTIAPCDDEHSAQSRVAPLSAAFALQEEVEQEDELVLLQTRTAADVLTQRFAAANAAGLVFDLTNDADSLWLAQIPPQPHVLAQQQSKRRSRAARNPARSASSGGNRSGGAAAVVKTERFAAATARGGS